VTDGGRGCFLAGEFGENGNIYHVGTEEEVSIKHLVETIGRYCGVKVNVVAGELRAGGTPRRCPAIGKLQKLGYEPKYNFDQLVERCVTWYVDYYTQKANA
jgi:UDP-glucose 4-epimerase